MTDQSPRYLPIPSDISDEEYLKAVLKNALDAMCLDINPEDFTAHTQNLMGDTALQCAATWGDIRAVRLLVEAGAKIDNLGEMNCTPLYEAINYGWSDIAEYLVQCGADPDIKCDFGDSPRELVLNTGLKVDGLTRRTLTLCSCRRPRQRAMFPVASVAGAAEQNVGHYMRV